MNKDELMAAINAKLPKSARLARRKRQQGGMVWAAVCPQNRYPHKYTLAHGVACWSWWDTLEEAAEELGIRIEP